VAGRDEQDERDEWGCDVAVVGAGIAGVTIAAELAAAGANVIVLEQEARPAHHTTGRSAAAFLETYGTPAVRALTTASRRVLAAGGEDGPFLTPRPLVWFALGHQQGALDAVLAAGEGRLQRAGAREVVELCPVMRPDDGIAAAIETDAQDIDVMALHQHYLRRLRSHGGEIVVDARVATSHHRHGAWHLDLAGAGAGRGARSRRVRAATVVDAAGAWADVVAGALGARPLGLQPLRRTIAVGRTRAPGWHPGHPFMADVDDRWYFRPEGPHVLLSPADVTPSEPCDARPDEVDVALAIDRVNAVSTLDVRSVVTTWAGLRTFAPDGDPIVGFDPEVEGLFWFAGQGGYGIQMAPALARLGAAVALGTAAGAGLPIDAAALDPSRLT
jgi:D-arginine dehydrogenase